MFPAFTTGALAQTDDIDYTTGVFFVNEDWYGHQNSTVNYLTEKGEWVYRVIQKKIRAWSWAVPISTASSMATGSISLPSRNETRDPKLKVDASRLLMPKP